MKICSQCGSTAESKTFTRGSFGIELVLWLCFLIPGLIYSIWRLSTRHEGCRACGSASLIPLMSPMGKKLAAELGIKHDRGYVSPPIDKNSLSYKLGSAVKKLNI